MRKEAFIDQWFLLPTVGMKKTKSSVTDVTEYRLTIAWLNFGISFVIYRNNDLAD